MEGGSSGPPEPGRPWDQPQGTQPGRGSRHTTRTHRASQVSEWRGGPQGIRSGGRPAAQPPLAGSFAPTCPCPHDPGSLTSTRWGVGLKPQRLHTWSLQAVQVL